MTIKQKVQILEEACSNHLAVNTFKHGTIDKLDQNEVQYPYVFLRPVTSRGVTLQNGRAVDMRHTFEMFVLDLPKVDDQDYLESMELTESIALDLFGYVNYGEYGNDVYLQPGNFVPVNEAFADRVVGYVVNVEMVSVADQNLCDYPQL